MTGYPLAALLRVRVFREKAAALEITRCAQKLEEARQACKQREQELIQYREWRIKEETRLFEAIHNETVSMEEVERYKQALLSLRGEEVQHEERILESKEHIRESEEALQDARKHHMEAMKNQRKIEEHKKRWQQEEKLRLERAEEAELEEFSSKSLLVD